ncbi:hypothetical protein [uncultured Polaribacter sp.]|uniref:hypothetical protein n=1 Tax=uncultured Polaribacter sp. TaxID=174711 RepID=UPI0030DB1EB5|tara:strand:- start:965 stop:2110 length:1146 start_codon:yes stop_codon:yes gene_type:complete
MKNIIILTLLLLVNTIAFAQEHNMGAAFNCKLKKGNFNTESYPCPACAANDKKEKDAKNAEIKRRNDKIIADAKAKKETDDKAYRDKLAADKLKEGAGNVLINAQKKAVNEDLIKINKSEIIDNSNLKYMVSDGASKFHDGKGVYIKSNNPNYKFPNNTFGTHKIEGTSIANYLYPAETGIVSYNGVQNEYCNDQNTLYYDIVDYKLNTLFNDESIHYIEHFYENWFLIGYLPCNNYEKEYWSIKLMSIKLYNVKTKKFNEIKIENPFIELSLTDNKGKSSDGKLVFHNCFYKTGEYNKLNRPIGSPGYDNTEIKHGYYELLFDKLSGGNNMWKSGALIRIKKSSNKEDYYYLVYFIDKDLNFKTFSIDKSEFNQYTYKYE